MFCFAAFPQMSLISHNLETMLIASIFDNFAAKVTKRLLSLLSGTQFASKNK